MAAEADINTRVIRLETGYEHVATKEDIANMRADMVHMKVDLIRWMVGVVIAGLTAAVGLTALILRVLGPWS